MDTIKLDYKNAAQHIQGFRKVFLKNYKKWALIFSSALGVLGLIMIYSGYKSGYDFEVTTFVGKGKGVNFYNYGIDIGLGVALTLVAIIYFKGYYNSRKIIFRWLDIRIRSYKEKGDLFTYTFSEEGILFENHDTKRYHQWEYYLDYKVETNFLFIYTKFHDLNIPYEIIPLEPLDESQKKIVVALLAKKIYKRM